MRPYVSICIPTYNRREYLRETLASIYAQTYRDYEIVVVDDGSTDGTEEMLKTEGHKVRYFRQENKGDAAARNKLIELAEGKYISFIDSDDLLMPDAIERMASVMENEGGNVIVYGPYIGIDENGQIVKRRQRKLYSGFVTEFLFQDIFIHSCGSMFPKSAMDEIGGFDTSLKVCSDYDLWLRLSLKYKFIALSEPTFKRRRHSGNLSSRSSRNIMTELMVLERFYYERGGKDSVPEPVAMQRLAKEGYRAARCALREGDHLLAWGLLRQAFVRKQKLKTAIFLGWAFYKRMVAT